MIKKIYYLGVSIMSVGFLLNTNPAYADGTCTTYCQENMCRHSPDLASICYQQCPEAQACHLAAFDEFRKLHGQNQRFKNAHTRKKPNQSSEITSGKSTLTAVDDVPSIETLSGVPILPPPPPPPPLDVKKTPKTLEEQIRETKELMEKNTQKQENSAETSIPPISDASSSNIHKMPETLMEQIRAGKQLNKVEESETKKSETLLDQIRTGKQLKNAQEREIAPEPPKPETLLDQIRAGKQLKNAQEREIAPEPPKPETLLDQIRAGKQLNKPIDRVPTEAWKNKVSNLSEVPAQG